MRLTEREISAIKDTFSEVFGDGEVFLFGSRIDDTKRGGDIDLYLDPLVKDEIFEKKIRFLARLQEKIGLQKIDVVFHENAERPIEREAIKNGVKL